VKTDGKMSLAITVAAAATPPVRGTGTAASKYFTETYLAGVLAIGKLFNSIYFAPPCEDSFGCYYLLAPLRWSTGGDGRARAFPPEGGVQ